MGTNDFDAAAFADLFDPAHREDPHPRYHALRAVAPLARIGPDDEVVVTGFEACETILRDASWTVDPAKRTPSGNQAGVLGGMDLSTFPVMLLRDPPDHTRLRRLVSRAFTPRTVERMRPHVAELLAPMLDGVRGAGSFDLIQQVAYPFPVAVIGELLGVPAEDVQDFAGWSTDAARLLDGEIDQATADRGVAALFNFIGYFEDLFARRRAEPTEDLISELLAVEDEGDVLSHDELLATTVLLYVAGHETTMNLIGNGMHALLSHPDQWARLVADPDLAPGAVEEVLRWDGPVHLTARTATQRTEVCGFVFEPGDDADMVVAAANRDPARHDDPDAFDITRADPRHLTFSHGMHHCLGAALARLEGQLFFEAMARRHPDAALVGDRPRRRDHLVLRGFESLPMTLG